VASFGMRLKQEREKQKVTLDDISLSTKISTRMLRALEEEHFDQLPGGIFNKGFIRAYARCLGMDEEQTIADYLATISPPGKNSEHDDQAPILEPPPREQNPAAAGLPWGMFAVAILIVALGFAAWGFYSRESQTATTASAVPAPNSPNVSSTALADHSSPQPPSDPGAAPAAVAKATQQTPPSPAGGEPVRTPATNSPVSAPNQSPSQDLLSQPPRPRTFVVLIKAREDSWLAVSIDGEVSTQGTLAAAAEKSVRAAQEITIRAGNIGALDFEFNGKKLPAQGGYGEVKTLTFGANGLHQPTPKPEKPAQLP
jgi:cytoskeleton protein RodZ